MCDGYQSIQLTNNTTIFYETDVTPEDGYGIIYLATSPSNKIYIGQTSKSLLYRAKEHCRNAFRQSCTAYNSKFYKSIRKHMGSFIWKVLFHVPIPQLNDLETKTIITFNSYKTGYNSTLGGEGTRGCAISDKHKLILSKIAKERTIGDKNPMYGKTHSQEAKAKMSKIHKGKVLSAEQRAQMLKINKGKIVNTKQREKISMAKGGRAFIVTKDGKIIGEFINQREFSRKFNIHREIIRKCLKNGVSYKGYVFKYKEEL